VLIVGLRKAGNPSYAETVREDKKQHIHLEQHWRYPSAINELELAIYDSLSPFDDEIKILYFYAVIMLLTYS
jgi:hypothetical protein